MTKKRFSSGMPAFLLAFILVFSACENSLVEVEGTVGISSQEAPVVTATAVKGGILLEWPPIIGASYNVWRKAGDTAPFQLDSDYLSRDEATGKYRYFDLVSDDNELIANTAYTYTVTASGSYKTMASTEVTATPSDIPAKGTKLAPVTGVTLALNQDANTITVSWAEPAAGIPAGYSIRVYRDGAYVTGGVSYFGQTSATIGWGLSDQTDGEYTARVTTTQDPSGYDSNTYFKDSDIAVSATGQRFEALFYVDDYGSTSLPSINNSSATAFLGTGDNSDRIAGFYATISFSSFRAKPGVIYSLERATVDAATGNDGTYDEVTLSTTGATATALPTGALTADVLGNLPVTAMSPVYDRGLPATAGKYQYRIKAVKGSVTQTKEISTTVTASTYSAISSSSISIATATGTDTKTYAVTPALSPKGALQAGDKLVFYYVKGASGVYETGPYTKSIEFTKADLEATTVTAKNLVITKGTDDDAAYVQAYIEFADGSKRSVSSNITVSGGVSGTTYYTDGSGNSIYYATLEY
jgi:hypothetical protein